MIPAEQVRGLDAERVDVLALWHVIWAYKFLIGAIMAVFAAFALYLAFTAIPVYRAEVTVTPVTESNMGGAASLANQFGGLASLVGASLGQGGDNSQEARALLTSRRLVEEFIKRNKLIPVLYPGAKPSPTLWFAVKVFREKRLVIREDKRTNLTVVSVDWTDAAVAAKWANDFVALANEMVRDRAVAESRASVNYLNSQIESTNVLELQRVLYNLIESETKTLMLANAKAEYAFTTIDPAVTPEIRFSPRRALMLLLGLAIGGVLGAAVAFAHNMFRQARLARRESAR